jgi:hypothetical protein
MNCDGIKIAWKIDRKAASARSVTKENPSRGQRPGGELQSGWDSNSVELL